ncbi:tetratricopeptide repeat protein [Spirochaeta isovalerica]|uniref:Tetratricopeptide (TPR) repeat protein n=1 Tax=Spirochaeta isovalerica TaxID=150 RepID=A0A841RB64_9SPIO|nr:tetratricopeptide repeat protein [Spirochaeta isovalerica]MBB6480250.1 tetratricopeptide (TPR) repeat protein [Spirochaeta isovalerica]
MMDDLFGNKADADRSDGELTQEQLNEISELSKKGYQLLKEGLLERAEACFSEILSMDPSNNYALVGMGDTLRKSRHFQDAIKYYQSCLSNHRGNNYALFGLADCYKALHQYNRAIDIWEEYLIHDDKNITVLTRIADAYRKVRNYEKSNEIYQRVLKMESNNSYCLIGLGHLNYDFRDYEKALYYWEKMLELNKSRVDIRVLTSLGNCHRKMKTFDEGIPYFEQALKMQPNNFYALFGLADCYRGLHIPDESVKYWNRILGLDPRNKVILTRAGDAYRNMGEQEKAQEYYTNALDIEYDIYAVLGLSLINRDKGNYEESATTIRNIIDKDPKNPRFYLELADVYRKWGKEKDAVQVLSDFLKTGNKNQVIQDMYNELKGR